MDSLFEPGYFDYLDNSSFLTFSSFPDDPSSPSIPEQDSDPCDSNNYFSFSSWDLDFPCSSTKDFSYAQSSAPSSSSDTSSPSPTNPFQVIFGAFEAPTPAAEIGIFHSGSKLGGNVASNRSVSSSDGWEILATPSAVSATSSESLTLAPSEFPFSKVQRPGFSWDDASTTLASSSYTSPATPAATAHRVASTGALSSTLPNPHKIRNVTSMPALTEESHTTGGTFGWFDPTELSVPTPCDAQDESDLVENFDWVFDQQGLGGMDGINLAQIIPALPSSAPAVPTSTTLFSAFEESDIPVLATGDALDEQETVFDFSLGKTNMTWLVPSNITPDVHVSSEYDLSQQLLTIDPMAMLAPSSTTYDESRPSSAPHLSAMEGNVGMLSAPTSDAMLRSHTSPAYASTSDAPYRSVSFSYPQPQEAPLAQPDFVRRASQPFPMQTQPTHVYTQPTAYTHHESLNVAPTMSRGVTMPAWRSVSEWDIHPQMNAADAQRYAHEEMAKRQAERAETRQKLKEKVLPMMESSVMQPAAPLIAPRSGPPIVGWSGPSTAPIPPVPVHAPRPPMHHAASYPNSMLTTAPLIVHPPPMAGPSTYTAPHRIHPPPHNAPMTSRPIARLPSPRRNASGPSPTKRSPSGRRKVTGGQGFSWGDDGMMFVNYTPKDADKLLSGVAPSGTQSKRKREEEAAAAAAKAVGEAVSAIDAAEDAERSKRARSGE